MLNKNRLKEYDANSVKEAIINWHFSANRETIFLLWDKNERIIFSSNTSEELLGLEMDSFIGNYVHTILHRKTLNKIYEHFDDSREKLTMTNIQLADQHNNKVFNGLFDTIYIDLQLFYICQLKDMTFINEMKETLINSEKLVLAGQLSAGLVHEIRNPLTSLKGFLQLVQAGIKQKEEYYKVIIREIEKLENITSELLQMAKPFKNSKQVESIHQLVEDVVFIMDTQVDLKAVDIHLDLKQDALVFCNATQIKQVLINLIKNGAEAMEKEGEIWIETYYEGDDYIAISITDKGHGISEELMDEIYTPFFTTKPSGTGLGLVITHHILDLHEGKLVITSVENEGATFTILLPFIKEQ